MKRAIVSIPLLAAPLAVLAIYPWLLRQPHDADWAIGMVALVAYPTTMFALLLAAGFRFRFAKKPRATLLVRLVYFLPLIAFAAAMLLALV